MILLVIDEKRSEDEGRVVCDIFYGDLSITKTGYISGKMKKVYLNDVEYIMDKKVIDYTFVNSGSIVIDYKEFIKAIKLPMVYVGYNNNRRISAIQNEAAISLENISIEKNKLFITTKHDVLKVDDKYHIIACADKTLFIKNNCLWSLDRTINKKNLKNVIFSKRPKSEIYKSELFYVAKNSVKYEICEKIRIVVNISHSRGKYYVSPVIYYNDMLANSHDDQSVLVDNRYYYRDFISEKKIKNYFKKFEMVSPDIYEITTGIIYNCIQEMINNGFEVYIDKKRAFINKNSFSNIYINNEIDWFDIKGSVEFDDGSIEISEFIGSNEPYIAINDKVVLVPENITAVFEMANSLGQIEKTPTNYMRILELAESYFDIKNLKDLFNDDIHLKISDYLMETLFEYQFDGVMWMKKLALRGFGGCLADDMGLGKTLQILAFLSDEDISKRYCKTIIIVPKTLLGNWINEFEKYNICDKIVSLYYGANRTLDLSADIYITTYGIAVSDFDILEKQSFDLVILDEAQKVKNPSAKVRKVIKKLSIDKVLFAATGTPYENNLLELWSIMDLTNNGILGSLKSFSSKYVSENDREAIDRLTNIISPFMLRRTKEEVLKKLPKKKQENIICLMDEKQKRLYNAMLIKLKKDLLKIKEPGVKKLQMLNGLVFLREICCHPKLINDDNYQNCDESIKLDIITELIGDAIQKNEKIVVYSQFTKFLKIIESSLIKNLIKYSYIDGQSLDRENQVLQFENQDINVFLISLKAGGFGLNLTKANKMIICDPWWNPAVERQAEDRIYRIGQNDDVTIYRLITKGTVEEKIQILKERKDELGNQVFDGLKDISELDVENLVKLFK